MESFTVELQNNEFSNITGSIVLPPNVTAWLQGNPLCSNANLVLQFCQCENNSQSSTNTTSVSFTTICPPPYECSSTSAQQCVCAAPLFFGYRLKSPGFAGFRLYIQLFEGYLTHGLYLSLNQLDLNSFAWEEGPRLRMYLKLFPVNNTFNSSEILRITGMFTGRQINRSDIFGPYELLNYRWFVLKPLSDVFYNRALLKFELMPILPVEKYTTVFSNLFYLFLEVLSILKR